MRSYRDLERLEHHGEISARCRKSRRDLAEITNIMARSVLYRRDLCSIGKISAISARCRKSRRDLAEIQKLTNMLARSLKSLARSRQSRRDLGKNFAQDFQVIQDLTFSCPFQKFKTFPCFRAFFDLNQFNRHKLWHPPKCVLFALFNDSSLSYVVLVFSSAETNLSHKTLIFQDFQGPTIKFHDFPGLETEIPKFHDFPGFP